MDWEIEFPFEGSAYRPLVRRDLHRLRAVDELIVDLLYVAEDKIEIIIHRPHKALTGDQLPIGSPDHSRSPSTRSWVNGWTGFVKFPFRF